MKILIIDDNEENCEMLKDYFEINNHHVTFATDGKTGIEMIKNQNPDRIILDLAMPDFSGFDVIKTLEENGIFEPDKIVINTAFMLEQKDASYLKSKNIRGINRKTESLKDLYDLVTRENYFQD